MRISGIAQNYYLNRSVINRNTFGASIPERPLVSTREYIRTNASPKAVFKYINHGIKDDRLICLSVTEHINESKSFDLPQNYLFIGNDGFEYIKPHLYINRIYVKPQYLRQGVCREAEKRIVEISKELGYEGRVILTSMHIMDTQDMIPSPTLAHYKNGFRFYDKKMNNIVEQVIRGEISPEYTPLGTMYYPIDVI